MDDLKEIVGITFFVIILLFSIIFILFLPIWLLEKWSCPQRWEDVGPAKYELMYTCRVKIDGKWVPELAIRKYLDEVPKR